MNNEKTYSLECTLIELSELRNALKFWIDSFLEDKKVLAKAKKLLDEIIEAREELSSILAKEKKENCYSIDELSEIKKTYGSKVLYFADCLIANKLSKVVDRADRIACCEMVELENKEAENEF